MKTLIIYYSFSGNNEVLALELQKRLDCDVQKIVELRHRKGIDIFFDLIFKRTPKIGKSNFKLQQYDRSILIAPIWAGKIASPLRSFIEQERENFQKYSFITVCTGPEGQAEKITDELIQLLSQKPQTVMELKINDLLPPDRKDKVKYATPYRINQKILLAFEREIAQFLQSL
jgi:flavodoxin